MTKLNSELTKVLPCQSQIFALSNRKLQRHFVDKNNRRRGGEVEHPRSSPGGVCAWIAKGATQKAKANKNFNRR